MKTTYLKHIRFLFCLSILFVLGCQKEDDEQRQTQNIKQNSISKTISGKDIPEVLSFIKSKSNDRMQFLLDDSNSPYSQFRNHEENLSLTNAITDEIKPGESGNGFWALGLVQILLILIYLFLIFMVIRLYFRLMFYLKKKIELTEKQLKD